MGKYIVVKEVEASDIGDAFKKEKKGRIVEITQVKEEIKEDKSIGFQK